MKRIPGGDPQLFVAAVLLGIPVLIGAIALIVLHPERNAPGPEAAWTETTVAETAEQTNTTAASTVTTPVQTTEVPVTAVAETGSEPAATTAVTENPLPPAYDTLMNEILIPRWGVSGKDEPKTPYENAGIAAAYLRDFRGEGKEDLLVIRLDAVQDGCAAVPVFQLYTDLDGSAKLLDEFECKMQWCEYTVRFSDGHLYVSGDYAGMGFAADTWLCTEIALQIQPDGDLRLENMQQDYIRRQPETLCPAEAEILLEMQLTADSVDVFPAARKFLLHEFSGT
ncbi:MAG: hypothetical protein MJ065_01395 [Oscillospiraceae bacterium]|nr:hypothetical protein [Oscillospiraceae bacterium]